MSTRSPGLLSRPGHVFARNHTLLACVLFVALVGALAWLAGSQQLAVYALSFWHYLLYWIAYRYGAVPLHVFKRDAVLTKSVSLLALATAYLNASLDGLSLALVASGFGLNALAASALGSDRTYYGHEVARLPPLRVTRFPYSVISHPMLVGNMLAYGGTLLNADFREQWWPLACAHVVMNLGLLAMERYVTPLRQGDRRVDGAGAGGPVRFRSKPPTLMLAAVGAGFGFGAAWLSGSLQPPIGAALGAAVLLLGYFLYCAYTAPEPPPGERCPAETEMFK